MTTKLFDHIQRIPAFLPTAVAVAAILYLSLHSFTDIPDHALFHLPHLDKAVHFAMYFGLTVTLCFDAARYAAARDTAPYPHSWRLWLLPLLLGGTLEMVQDILTLTRSGDIFDFLANAAGIAVGYAVGIRVIAPRIRAIASKSESRNPDHD